MSLSDFLHWVRGHKSSVAGILFVAAGCVALTHLSRRVHHLQPRMRPVASAPAADEGPPAGVVDRGGSASAAARGRVREDRSATIRAEFESAGSALEFIQQAILRPQEGGRFYALLAWRRCNDVAQHAGGSPVHVGDDGAYEAAAVVVQDVEQRCGGVLEAWPTLQMLYGVSVDQHPGNDLLLPPDGRGVVAAATRATADADVGAALRSGDAWAAAEALRANAAFIDVGDSAGDEGTDRQLRELGAGIVGCELVGDCRGGLQSALHCTRTGDCTHADWRDVIRSQVPEAQRAVFERMVGALRRRTGSAPAR